METSNLGVVDADTHVSESQAMWEYFDEHMHSRRPILVSAPEDTVYKHRNAFWLIDGNIFPKSAGKGGVRLITPSAQKFQTERKDINIGVRELTDIGKRLKEMDKLKVEIQVIYPTLFLVYLTDDIKLEIALCKAYNSFMGQACSKSGGRLKWVAIPPLKSIEESLREIERAKGLGAVGLFFRGIEGERTLDNPYFFPIYESASRLDLPICIHTGAGCPSFSRIFDLERNSSFAHVRMLPLIAFRDLVANGIPDLFPSLRFGIIEAASQWVPHVLHALKRFLQQQGRDSLGSDLFAEKRLFVACEADEDIPYVLKYIGEDNLIIGSDYGHNDPSAEPQLVATMRSREDLSSKLVDKILVENPRRFYGI
ncbi:MAG: amidohydrolase family protein [Candidatus Binatia bacterium]